MTTTLAATYPCLADALRTRQQLQELNIPSEDIGVAMRRGSSDSADPEQPDVMTLGWVERAIAGWPSELGDTDISRALSRAGVLEWLAAHLAHDVDLGGVLVATVIDAPARREAAELIMARRARYPDLVGEAQEARSELPATQRRRSHAQSESSPRA
jgi:hypothetical protein